MRWERIALEQMKQSSSNEELDVKIEENKEELIIKSGALSKEKKFDVKKEFIYVAIIFLLSIVGFKIIFSKEGILVVAKVVASFYFLYIIPGFAIMYYWKNKLDFLERFIIG